MHRPFVFLATSDPKFEHLATDAILETRHGVRRAQNLGQATGLLADGTHGIALAIIDITSGQFGEDLLETLNGCHVDFPILAISEPGQSVDQEHLAGMAITQFARPATITTLRDKIKELCAVFATPLMA